MLRFKFTGCRLTLTPSSPPLGNFIPLPYADMDSASDKGPPRRSPNFENSGGGPVFESPCGRRGCSHVFTYSGTNPFVDLAAMVAAHRRHCVRRREVSTSHRCTMAGWQPPPSLVQQFAASKSMRRDAGHDWTTSFKWERACQTRAMHANGEHRDRHVDDMDYEESRTDEGWGSSADDDAQDDVTADGSTSRLLDSRGTCAEHQLGPKCPPISVRFRDRHVDDTDGKEPRTDDVCTYSPIDRGDEAHYDAATSATRGLDSHSTCAENQLVPVRPPISSGVHQGAFDAGEMAPGDTGTRRGRHVDGMDCEDPRTDEGCRSSPIGEGGDTHYDAATNGGTSGLVDRRRTSAENQFVPGCSPISAGGHQGAFDAGAVAVAPGDTVARTRQRQKVKKTARKEAERKALLEADPWALAVSATCVVCGGCRQIIKLDARSRYYPGLWEKHRDRCDGVRTRRAAALAETQKKQRTNRLEAEGTSSCVVRGVSDVCGTRDGERPKTPHGRRLQEALDYTQAEDGAGAQSESGSTGSAVVRLVNAEL
ncbi:hypothetical protein GGX14DRAFT_667562 [Mycena pura]|uniref:Uncharacterized protein n=1 Tax=Mycena pura TaxID=153505 RepID=A0AAD6V0J1_9AGAR|nr:hypothetical protein GGX14DRAFT_667562 [Mycena pura]